jgi:hypothetical protein
VAGSESSDQSFDPLAGSILTMFDFNENHFRNRELFLDPTTAQKLRQQ